MIDDSVPFEGNLLGLVTAALEQQIAKEVLPESRPLQRKVAFWRNGVAWTPVFCASCGKPYGFVPDELCTFACWLCNECSDKYGAIAGTMMMPDEQMWAKVHLELLERYGRFLSNEELLKLKEESTTPLGTLLREVN
jgi:hypothetical protein